MFYQLGTNLHSIVLGFLISVLLVFTQACDDNPASDEGEDDLSESLTMIEGNIDSYEFGAQDLYESEEFVDLISGSIDENGEFTVELLREDAIQEALKPLTEDSDGFVAMYCRGVISEELNDDHQFVDVAKFNFTYGNDNSVGVIGYSSESPNMNIYPPQSDNKGDYQVRWIYSSQELTISETCEGSGNESVEVDVEFSKGWNEVIFDVSEEETRTMHTGNKPAELEWVLET